MNIIDKIKKIFKKKKKIKTGELFEVVHIHSRKFISVSVDYSLSGQSFSDGANLECTIRYRSVE